nr:MetaGeneMark_Unknown Function [uncultured bacterium]
MVAQQSSSRKALPRIDRWQNSDITAEWTGRFGSGTQSRLRIQANGGRGTALLLSDRYREEFETELSTDMSLLLRPVRVQKTDGSGAVGYLLDTARISLKAGGDSIVGLTWDGTNRRDYIAMRRIR